MRTRTTTVGSRRSPQFTPERGPAWASASARTAGSGRPGWSDQAAVGGPAGQLVPVGQLQLAEHGGHVRLHRLHRDVQLPGDLLVRVAPGDVAEDLPLPDRQLVELRV